jgi:hypothetical protein
MRRDADLAKWERAVSRENVGQGGYPSCTDYLGGEVPELVHEHYTAPLDMDPVEAARVELERHEGERVCCLAAAEVLDDTARLVLDWAANGVHETVRNLLEDLVSINHGFSMVPDFHADSDPHHAARTLAHWMRQRSRYLRAEADSLKRLVSGV